MLKRVTQLKTTRYDVFFYHESTQLDFNITGTDQVRPCDFTKQLKTYTSNRLSLTSSYNTGLLMRLYYSLAIKNSALIFDSANLFQL